MKRKKVLAILALTAVLLCGITIGAAASSTLKDITAQLNYGLTVKYNNEDQAFYDANGARVYPISYGGTTYLPIRAIGNMLGLEVGWDQPTQTVLLGRSVSGVPIVPYQIIDDGYKGSDRSFTMGGKTYDGENDIVIDSELGQALYNLEGKYETLTFEAGRVDGGSLIDAVMHVYVDGVEIVNRTLSATDLPEIYEIPVEGARQVQITMTDGNGYWVEYGIGNVLVR